MTIRSVSILALIVLVGSGSLSAQSSTRVVPKEFDHVVPLASQSQWSRAGQRSALLLQQARTTRHQVAWYFKGPIGQVGLRFFVWPNGAGTVLESIKLMPNELVRGDLLFESPTRSQRPL